VRDREAAHNTTTGQGTQIRAKTRKRKRKRQKNNGAMATAASPEATDTNVQQFLIKKLIKSLDNAHGCVSACSLTFCFFAREKKNSKKKDFVL
jgi:hypothetical protein